MFAAASVLLAAARPAAANLLPPGPVMGHPADYVIVTPSAFATEFQRLANWKTHTGIPALVKTLESVVAEYPAGRDDAERMRMFLKDAKAEWSTHWVLLGGMPPQLPVRLVHTTFYGTLDFASDLYFADLDGTWDADGDGVFGEGYLDAAHPGDNVELHADVFVGRAPVRTAAEAHAFVDKTLRVSFLPIVPPPPQILLAADVLFPQVWTPGSPFTMDGAETAEELVTILSGTPGLVIQKLYENSGGWPGAQPLTRASLLAALRGGTDWFADLSFGSPRAISTAIDSVTLSDLDGLTDAPRPTQAWLLGSMATNVEDPDCVGAHFVRGPTGGAATCVGSTTFTFPTALRYYVEEFARQAFAPNLKPVGQANALSIEPFIPFSYYDGVNRMSAMSLALLGDPETRLRLAPAPPIAVDAPASLLVGAPGFDVVVTRDGAPVAGARACASLGDDALAIATTDDAGHAHLDFTPAHAGTADLVVTAPEGDRYESSPVVAGTLAVDEAGRGAARLEAPRPNPAVALVRLAGETAGGATLGIYDAAGREVYRLVLAPGRFDAGWDLRDHAGRPVTAGLYFARLRAGSLTRLQRFLVVR